MSKSLSAFNRYKKLRRSNAELMSGADDVVRKTIMPSPLRKRFPFSSILNKYISTLVIALLSVRGPPTIPRFVVTIIVDAIKRMLFTWPAPHISKKSLKREPSVAHRNSSSSISGIGGFSWIGAPALHGSPRSIFRSSEKTVFFGVMAMNKPHAHASNMAGAGLADFGDWSRKPATAFAQLRGRIGVAHIVTLLGTMWEEAGIADNGAGLRHFNSNRIAA